MMLVSVPSLTISSTSFLATRHLEIISMMIGDGTLLNHLILFSSPDLLFDSEKGWPAAEADGQELLGSLLSWTRPCLPPNSEVRNSIGKGTENEMPGTDLWHCYIWTILDSSSYPISRRVPWSSKRAGQNGARDCPTLQLCLIEQVFGDIVVYKRDGWVEGMIEVWKLKLWPRESGPRLFLSLSEC